VVLAGKDLGRCCWVGHDAGRALHTPPLRPTFTHFDSARSTKFAPHTTVRAWSESPGDSMSSGAQERPPSTNRIGEPDACRTQLPRGPGLARQLVPRVNNSQSSGQNRKQPMPTSIARAVATMSVTKAT
jgi:hypothetical protein